MDMKKSCKIFAASIFLAAVIAGVLTAGNIPVSYTHLDVYKRQLQGINSFPGKLRLCSFAAVKVVIDKGGIVAVSYTHLPCSSA